jgi:hypothetical protein
MNIQFCCDVFEIHTAFVPRSPQNPPSST